jgi:hypothetical protein
MNRLQKIIAARGYCSRRKAEELMAQGRVKVNGNVITEMGSSFEDDVEIAIDNKPLVSDNEKYYYLFHKPRMVVTTLQDPQDRRTVADFFKSEKSVYIRLVVLIMMFRERWLWQTMVSLLITLCTRVMGFVKPIKHYARGKYQNTKFEN